MPKTSLQHSFRDYKENYTDIVDEDRFSLKVK